MIIDIQVFFFIKLNSTWSPKGCVAENSGGYMAELIPRSLPGKVRVPAPPPVSGSPN